MATEDYIAYAFIGVIFICYVLACVLTLILCCILAYCIKQRKDQKTAAAKRQQHQGLAPRAAPACHRAQPRSRPLSLAPSP